MKTFELLNEDESKELIPHGGDFNFSSRKVGMNNDYMKQAFGQGLVRDLDVVGQPQSLKSWQNLMNSTSASTYNDFSADEVYSWLSQNINAVNQLKFIPAREGSVALYIMGPIEHLKQVEKAISDHMPSPARPSEINIEHIENVMQKDPMGGPKLNRGWKTIGKNFSLLRLWWD